MAKRRGAKRGELRHKGEELVHKDEESSRRPWYKDATALISLAAMIVTVISAVTAIVQTNISEQQNAASAQANIMSDQEELVTLVTAIAQNSALIAPQPADLQGNQGGASQTTSEADFTVLTDSEEAEHIIDLLHSNGVTATDYFETALGLQTGENYSSALSLLAKGVNLSTDPRTHASILRDQAEIFYDLGDTRSAEMRDEIAEQSFDHVPGVTNAAKENNTADTEFFDSWFQATISCSTAEAEMTAGEKVYTQYSGAMSPGTASALNSAKEQLKDAGCTGGKTHDSTQPDLWGPGLGPMTAGVNLILLTMF
jgi:hypothetical protein